MSIPHIPDSGTFIINVNTIDRVLTSGISVISPVSTPFAGTVVYDTVDADAEIELEHGFLQVSSSHELGTFELQFHLVDPDENESNTATVRFIVVNFGPHNGDDIPNPEPVIVDQSNLIISHAHVLDILQRITDSPNELEDEIEVSMWLESDQSGTVKQYSYAELRDNLQGNETFGDLRYTPTEIGEDTAHLTFAYNGWEYELTVTFTVSASMSGGAGIGVYGDLSVDEPNDGPVVVPGTGAQATNVLTIGIIGAGLALVIGMIAGPILGVAVLAVILLIVLFRQ
jgi:hypothetical protein